MYAPFIRHIVSLSLTQTLAFLEDYPFEDPRDEPGLCSSATDTQLNISVVINDNIFDSNPAIIFVEIVCINDPPVLDLDVMNFGFGSSIVFIEDSLFSPVFNSSIVSLTDSDSSLFYNGSVSLTNRQDIPEYLSFYISQEGLDYTVYGNNSEEISFYSEQGISAAAVSCKILYC